MHLSGNPFYLPLCLYFIIVTAIELRCFDLTKINFTCFFFNLLEIAGILDIINYSMM